MNITAIRNPSRNTIEVIKITSTADMYETPVMLVSMIFLSFPKNLRTYIDVSFKMKKK
jgi:hypothetical protein